MVAVTLLPVLVLSLLPALVKGHARVVSPPIREVSPFVNIDRRT
jgi:hypothetical protein